MAIKLKKTLYVGLGGTGVATLLKIKKCFIDIYDEIPPMIGFLAIDTDGAANSKSVTSNLGKQVRLDANELLICTVPNALDVYRANPRVFDWIPSKNVSKLQAIAGNGAGQVRSNGRFIAYFNHENIKGSIQSAVSKIHQLIPRGSKFEVDTMNGAQCPTDINVIASVAGGTGGGMLIDVLSIIRDAFDDGYKIHPWIVLPDVFRAMNQGPAMGNVYYNAYGVLRELDYIMHHDPKDPVIDFGHTKVDRPLFDYAYIINNSNLAGVSFNTLDDLVDVIAKSAFLPANTMGAALKSPFDNIVAQQMGGTYDIRKKKAWAASASSAELLYDGQAVGRARAYTIIRQLCDSMMQSPFDGSDDANAFVDNSEVLIRENQGRNDVIDALSSDWPPIYELDIDENTSHLDIDTYIENNCGNDVLEATRKALEKKLANTNDFFEKKIIEIMGRTQGKVDAAIKFIQALLNIVSNCKEEMESEEKDYRQKINDSERTGWSGYLNDVKNKGIAAIFAKTNKAAVENLQMKLHETVMNRREETRRSWAIKFYTSFGETIRQKLQKIEGLKANLDQIGKECTRKLIDEQQIADSKSKFQIFLHTDDVMNASRLEIDDTTKTAFGKYIDGGVAPWIDRSVEDIKRKLWDFAKERESVKEAVNQDIDAIMRSMPEDKVKSCLDRLKILASPLWTYNTQGFTPTAHEFDRFFIVGVGNRDTSILSTDDRYKTYFDSKDNKASFASTNQKDRVYVLSVEDLLPIYAVNNFSVYERNTGIMKAQGFMMANYIDEKLNNRMISEKFSVMPTVETDNVLKYWVYGFVFGYIHYDSTDNQYWIRSMEKGDPIKKFRYNLNYQRDVAFNLFKSEGFDKEVEKELTKKIEKEGNISFKEKIDSIKNKNSYKDEYAQLSPLEASNIDEPKFKEVRDLLAKEIVCIMTEG